MIDRISFESLSAAKTLPIFKKSINVMDREETTTMLSQQPENAVKLRSLQKQSRGYFELNILVKAINALDNWRKVEHEYTT